MSKSSIFVQLDTEAKKILEKRAKTQLMTLQELVADILRRSVLSYKSRKSSGKDNVNDKFLTYFSRRNIGRKPGKKKKKSKKK